MKIKTKYINTNKPKRMMSNLSYEEDLVYQAHSIKQPGFTAFVPESYANILLEALRMCHKTGNAEHATDILKELGDI